ncbi:MAG: hypothetical protein LUG60_03235 [Erysipelotrichaceae bacterium]|nr:hypothetical protein [Erysipelotrichaceae bacterium]
MHFNNVKYATRLKNKLMNNIESLSFMPERYRLYDEQMYADTDLRVMVVDKIKNVVIIYHIFSNKSDIKVKFNLS